MRYRSAETAPSVPGGNCRRTGCEIALTCATAALISALGWKKILMMARPSMDLRFDVLDIVHRGGERALVNRGDALFHLLGAQAGVVERRGNDREYRCWEKCRWECGE